MGKRTSVLVLGLMLVGIATLFIGVSHGSTGEISKVVPTKAAGEKRTAPPSVQKPFDPGRLAYFTENQGQVSNGDVRYYTRSGTMQAGFTKGAILLKLAGSAREVLVKTTFDKANDVSPEARGRLTHRSNFFRGSDPAGWRTDVPNYGEVVYSNLYDGIDLVYKATPKGLKYDFIVHPGADPSHIVVSHEGIEGLEVDSTGEMVLHTAIGDLRDAAPSASQGPGSKVPCQFVPRGPRSYGFVCDGWDRTRTLVIDPLIYSTYVGGSNGSSGQEIATDASGNAYIAGYSSSDDFPTTPGAFDPVGTHPLSDVIIFKLNSTGTDLIYSTYVGGSERDHGYGIAVSPTGQAVVTGNTQSDDFPTTAGAFDETHNGSYDAFVLLLDPTGSSLEYSTFIGGSPSSGGGGGGGRGKKGGGGSSGGNDHGRAVALNSSGEAVITGNTDSTNFPTTSGAFDTSHNGDFDVFLCLLSLDGSALLSSTFLGGSGLDQARGVALDGAGDAYVAGYTASNGFPTTGGAYDTKKSGGNDAFVAKIDISGSALVYSTYIGGRKSDQGTAIAVDGSGNAYLTGQTLSNNFPTTSGAYQTSIAGPQDAFVTKLNPSGSALVWSTYLGGSGGEIVDRGNQIALDSAGQATVTGDTMSTDFPTTSGAFSPNLDGIQDAFVSRLSADGASLVYSTYLGGSDSDWGAGIAVDAADEAEVYVMGVTRSTDYPTTAGAFDETYNGGSSTCFVTKLPIN